MAAMAGAEETTGERIARARQEQELTQGQLAVKVGVSRNSIANWEGGKHFPLRYKYKVEQVLGISLDDDGLPAYVTSNLHIKQVRAILAIPETEMPLPQRLAQIRFWLAGHPQPRSSSRREAAEAQETTAP